MMKLAALVWLACAFPAQDKYKFDYWEAWNGFETGSTVEFELEASGMKMKVSKTIDKKEKDEIRVKSETVFKYGDTETKSPTEEKVRRPFGSAGDDVRCPLCGKGVKEHQDLGKWSQGKFKVGERELDVHLYETPAKNCKGDPLSVSKVWYSPEVPGHVVKLETEQMKMTLLRFEAKKK